MSKKKQPCRLFHRPGGCRYGASCRFSHATPLASSTETPRRPTQDKNRGLSNTEVEFRNWRFMIPMDGNRLAPLGPQLSTFLRKGAELVASDPGIRQDVISRLASTGGLARVRELAEQDFSSLGDSMKLRKFLSHHVPFFQIITHPDVLCSILLEQPLGDLFTFLYGINGQRAVAVFSFIAQVLPDTIATTLPATSPSREEIFQLTFFALAKVIDINGSAQINPDIVNLTGVFSVLLTQIQQRLGIGDAIPEFTAKPKSTAKQTSFGIPIDPPGHLSPQGPRHNNDHADIQKIEVLPTWQEVQSLRPEYLPVKDPSTWHKPGIQGLLDRNFRLLREDTVGQLRDVIQAELARMQNPGNSAIGYNKNQQGVRTYTYHGTGLLLFCSVVTEATAAAAAKPSATSNDAGDEAVRAKERSLHSDSETAYLRLCLVEQSDEHIDNLLRRSWNSRQMCLVEFPGVLLPAFQPTLKALQQMSSGDVPFSEFLAPSQEVSGVVRVPPPAYSRRPNFNFNLRSITNGTRTIQLSPQGEFRTSELVENSSLDDAQAKAVVDSLTHSFALIQGPPGTGKSYTGVALIKALLENRKAANLGPIVCVCYTNHALDQLLEHLVDANVPQIIRVGSRSKSEVLRPLLLREVSKKLDKTKAEKAAAWELRTVMETDEKEIDDLISALDNADSWMLIKNYLQQYSPHQHDDIFGSTFDEDGFMLPDRDSKRDLSRWLRGGFSLNSNQPERTISALQSAPVLSLSRSERQKLHRYWVNQSRDSARRNLVHALREYNNRRTKYQRNHLEMDLRCLQEAHIIGITTSGLARNLEILRRVRAKVMICEEAGEVLESHTLTAMLPSVEHAILIGDHEQLRPQIQRYDLGREHPRGEQYSLDVSLFERLVHPNDDTAIHLPYITLETQRRMHPMISRLVRETIYPNLQDAQSTANYPLVPGMKDRLFWFDHREYEADADQSQSTSRSNDFEVSMTLGLVSHLMKQGVYRAEDIAVLTPYLGQLHKLRTRLGQMWELIINDRDLDDLEKAGISNEQVSKTSALNALKVATIDNFQGEEAKVVVISLVRSNKMNNCGFLKTSNRINVLLSRAQHGMFIIGNSETAGSVQMWADVLDILRTSRQIGNAFELQCPRHPDKLIKAAKPDDFTQFSPEGGCNLKFCQICAADSVKDQQVDFIEMLTYREVDLDEDPCLFPPCGHVMTMANMDGHMDMSKHYLTAPDGSIARYGRIIRRALLDESTKKFILWSQNDYHRLQTRFQDAHSELTSTADAVFVRVAFQMGLKIATGGPSVHFKSMKAAANTLSLEGRYRTIFSLRSQIHTHVNRVQHEEQPFRKVHDFCQDARRRREVQGSFTFSEEVLQTRAHLLASSLLIRCDLAILSDLVAIWRDKLPAHLREDSAIDLSGNRLRCLELLQEADATDSPAQKVEALLFYAQHNAIERLFAATPPKQEQLREEALAHVATARKICAAHPGTTGGLLDEVDAVGKMLRGDTFFSVVTSEERRAVLAAMATEFRGTGHWYYCQNGHPFTVGECGMPMQLARCPQCGAAAGGANHQPAEGVSRAEDLERELRDLHL
ncbi:Nf-x1 finger and helicase domain protein [Lasiodiplodia theobromae]|uniref:Nf-x1 finger and helicase domain protein n=1 Tax=Lasiodiplodia theobromae TaxID=45133 RepID=UPI0015C2C5D5|nr:Nf-x1 finger and helicase domain protein [Lasiodiplodia theobromae]KAF4541309.1 Nf-x1 finger and helicase domain protein [Lasiodiplodia theobromae]